MVTNLIKTIFKHNWLVYNIMDKAISSSVKKYAKGKLIDIGGGTKPYAEMVRHYVDEHIGIDHQDTMHDKNSIDRFGTAYEIPAEDGKFDSAICTLVLEHLEEPETALREFYRILKTGGIAIYTVPFQWHIHEEPNDYYR